MKTLSSTVVAAAVLSLAAANPAAQTTCKKDACASVVKSATQGFADCSSFLDYTVLHTNPTVTRTVTPGPATQTSYIATVTQTENVVSESRWPTTINTEISSYNFKREADATKYTCSPDGTISPEYLPTYASSACSNTARYSSVCSCAGVKARTTSFPCTPFYTTVTASPTATITHFATSTYVKVNYVTTTLSTALVDDIRCNDVIGIDEDLPAYKIICEAQGVGNRNVIGGLNNTDWDNCVEEATFGLSASDWEFDLVSRACTIYDEYPAGEKNGTTPRKNHVYAYICNDSC